MQRLTYVAAATGLLLSSVAGAALKSESDMDALVDNVTSLLGHDRSGDAFDALIRHWPTPDKSELASMRTQIVDAGKVNVTKFGGLVGTEKIRSCRVGRFLYKTQTVLKYERGLVFWNFTFYNPGTGWILDSYRFDNKNFIPLTDACNFQ